jgi:hypothetical protein
MTTTQKIFQHQIWHLLSAMFLIIPMQLYLSANPSVLDGSLWGIHTQAWFWLAMVIPVLHQAYVWLVWRLELYRQVFTGRWGVRRAFRLYAIGFSILFVGRLIAITLLAVSSRDTLGISPVIAYVLAAIIMPLVGYLFY